VIFFSLYSFAAQGMKYILPKTLDSIIKKNNPVNSRITFNNTMKICSIAGGIASFLTGLLIENEFFQRLRLIKILLILSFICSISVLMSENYFIALICFFKSLFIMLDQVLEVYSSETISTRYRVFFLSMLNVTQSISIFSSAYVTDKFLKINYKINFIVFTGLLGILVILSVKFKKEKFKSVVK